MDGDKEMAVFVNSVSTTSKHRRQGVPLLSWVRDKNQLNQLNPPPPLPIANPACLIAGDGKLKNNDIGHGRSPYAPSWSSILISSSFSQLAFEVAVLLCFDCKKVSGTRYYGLQAR